MEHRLVSTLILHVFVHARAGSLAVARPALDELTKLVETNKPAPEPRALAYVRRDGAQVLLAEGRADQAATQLCAANDRLVGLAVPFREQVEGWLRCAQALNRAGRHPEAAHAALQAENAIRPRMGGLPHSAQLGRALTERGLGLLPTERETGLRLLKDALVQMDDTLGPLATEAVAARQALSAR